MTDYLLDQRPSKRPFYGTTANVFDTTDDDEEQYFAFSKAAADPYSIVGMTNTPSSIIPEKEESTGSVNSMSMDDVKIHTSNNTNTNNNTTSNNSNCNNNSNCSNNNSNKGIVTNVDVPNVGCKAEPSSKETAEASNGNKIGKSPSSPSKPLSSSSSSSASPSSSSPISSSSSPSSQAASPQQSQSSPSTQQQMTPPPTNNKKRTRATPEQLAILEETFKTNTSPNSKVREALAEKVNMSERSIQIWFQNRRAKMKAMQKRAHLMINQDTINHHFMACMPGYGHNLYPFRMPIHHAQRIALPRSYSTNDLTPAINNVALGMRPQPNSGLGITVPQGFWPSGPLTAPITPLSANDPSHLMNGFPFSANSIQQQQTQRFPISPNASPNSNTMNPPHQAIRIVANHPTNGIPIKMNDQNNSMSTPLAQQMPHQPQQFTPPQEFVSPTFNNQVISVISCETLTIGTWRRILTMQAPTDLLCYYTIPQNVFTYHITNDNTQFKMEFPLTDITAIEYRPIDDVQAQIAIEVKDPPHFYMESPQGGWNMCKDFTEDRQATRHMRHVMKGRSVVMKPQLIKLMQDDPLLAKVITILDTPVENQKPEIKSESNGQQQQMNQVNDQEQQNPPRRSSYPTSGTIGYNEESSSLSDREDYKSSTSLLKQIARTRRAASVPVSPIDEKSGNSNSANTLIHPTMASSSTLQVNTASPSYIDLCKATENSSPEFCSSPMELNSSSLPTSPLYVFDNSPTLMDSSPLLNQDTFVSLPSHNLSSLTMDSTNLIPNEQINELNAMVGFPSSMSGQSLTNLPNDDFAAIFNNMSSGSDTASDGSEFLTFDAMGDSNDGFPSTNSMMNLDISWVGNDVSY